MAQRVALGDPAELTRLNHWLANWSRLNPPYLGVNWKCGQEASIRVLHLAAAALILDQAEQPLGSLCDLLRAHLRRIAPTMAYAIGQQNNHGTTEAAALFVGGSWLASQGVAEAEKWEASLIVVGTHGRRGVARILMGSGAEQIIRIAPGPVLVIRGVEPD